MDARDRRIHPTEDLLCGYLREGYTQPLDNMGYENPGPTPNMRGIEPNTGKRALEYPYSTDMHGTGLDGPVLDPTNASKFPDAAGQAVLQPNYFRCEDPHGDPMWAPDYSRGM